MASGWVAGSDPFSASIAGSAERPLPAIYLGDGIRDVRRGAIMLWPLSIDPALGRFSVAQVPVEDLRAAPFLDHRLATDGVQQSTAIDAIEQALAPTSAAPVFIVHSAFCGSTLLAGLLDETGACLALKEPHVLAQLANAKRAAGGTALATLDAAPFTRALDAALALMRGHDTPHTLIKPTNFANNLIPELLARDARILFLHSGLESFLQSLVRRGAEASVFIRQLWRVMLADGLAIGRIPPAAAMLYSDLQIAAVLWTQQMEVFRHWLRDRPAERCAAMDFDRFEGNEAAFVSAAAAFLFPGRDPRALLDRLQRDGLSRDSKTGSDRDAIRSAETIGARDRAVVEDVLAWAQSITLGAGPPWTLPNGITP